VVSVSLPAGDDISGLDGVDLDRVLWELEVVRRKVEAAIVGVVDRCDRSMHYAADGHRSVRAWSQATTNCSPVEAQRRHRTAKVLRDLDVARGEFVDGRVGVAQVHELARVGSNPRCHDQLAGSEQVLLDAAKALEFTDFVR